MQVKDIIAQKDQYFIKPPGAASVAVLVAMIAGAGILASGLVSEDPRMAWGAYLFNLFFFFCLGLGGLSMSAIQDVVGAVWARPIKRIWEAFGCFVPVSAVMFAIFLVAVGLDIAGAKKVYIWLQDPEVVHHFHGKDIWLSSSFFFARSAVILLVFTLCAVWQLKQTFRRDMLVMAGQIDQGMKVGVENQVKLRFWSGLLLVIYGVCLTFFGMDLIMSLSPLWFSTLFGGWQFAIMMQTFFAFTLITMFALKGSKLGGLISRQQFHDCGKLMHGFTVFFAYTTFAHILTYWYGNVPEETGYFMDRMREPWLSIIITIPIIAFVIPLYVLIFQSAKWTAWVTIPLALMILGGQWLTNLILVMPEVFKANQTFEYPARTWVLPEIYFPTVEIGGFLLFAGLFMATFFYVARRIPMVGMADPLLQKGLDMGHH